MNTTEILTGPEKRSRTNVTRAPVWSRESLDAQKRGAPRRLVSTKDKNTNPENLSRSTATLACVGKMEKLGAPRWLAQKRNVSTTE